MPRRIRFGVYALFLMRGKVMTNLNFLKLKLFFKRFVRKPEKTLKKFWLSPIFLFTISLKSKGARMGKGKGKKLLKMLRLNPGKIFLEVSNIRLGRMFFFIKHLQLRLSLSILLYSNLSINTINNTKNRRDSDDAKPVLIC